MEEIASPTARTEPVVGPRPGFIEWGAVLAGTVLAAALSFTLLSFGTAIGLSATSPWPHSGLPAKVIASLAVFWTMAQQIGSLMIGGYVAGRMRARWHESGHESEFRDGLHGGLVWAVAIIFSVFLILAAAGGAVKTGAELAGKAASLTSVRDPMDGVLDTLLRPTATTDAAPADTSPSSSAGANAPRAAGATPDETRTEMSRVLASSTATGMLTPENRTNLARLVVQRTGVPQQEAEKRVDTAVIAARDAADKARRAAILTGFVTATGLVLSLGAAWWAAIRGGRHRDGGIPARFAFGNRRRTSLDKE
jgi:hypothetical protein